MTAAHPDLRLGVIGAGAIAGAYAEALTGIDGAMIAAVADVDEAAAASFGRRLDCVSHPSAASLIKSSACDAAIVCAPPAMHAEICLMLIEQGIPVLCEKPLAVGAETARYLTAAASDQGVLLAMASKFRYVDDLVQARYLLAAGAIGEPVLFENTFASKVDMSRRWNSDPDVSGGGVIIDNGTHSVEIARFLFGPITDVLAAEAPRIQDIPVEDTAQLLVRTANGPVGTIELSWSLDKQLESYLRVSGTDGTLRVGWAGSRYRRSPDHDWVPFGSGYDKRSAIGRQLRNFCDAVRGEAPFAVSDSEAVASVEVIDAAYTSLREGRWAHVDSAALLAEGPSSPGL